jgi:hypothetical protein
VVLARKRTIPTERPPHVGEVSANQNILMQSFSETTQPHVALYEEFKLLACHTLHLRRSSPKLRRNILSLSSGSRLSLTSKQIRYNNGLNGRGVGDRFDAGTRILVCTPQRLDLTLGGQRGRGVKLTSHLNLCRRQEWCSYNLITPHVLMAQCLIN